MSKIPTLLILAWLLAGSARAADPMRILSITEKPVPGQRSSPCPPDRAVCYADIESTLFIAPDISPLLGAGDRRSFPDEPTLASERQSLIDALAALERSLDLSRQILELVAAGGPAVDERGPQLSAQFEAEQRALITALQQYVRQNAAEFGLSPEPTSREIRRALRDAFPMNQGRTDDWIGAELRKVDQLAAERAAAVRARAQLSVRLGAFRVRPGTEPVALHLPGYDNIPAGELRPFQRISFEISPADQAKLAEEMKFNAEVIAKIQAIRTKAQENGDLLKEIVTEAKGFVDALQQGLQGAREDLEADLEGLTEITPELANLRTAAAALTQAIEKLEGSVDSLEAAFAVPSATDANRPDLLLLQIMGQLRPLQDGRPLRDVVDQARAVRESAERLRSQVAALTGTTAAVTTLRQNLGETIQEVVAAASNEAGPLLSLVGSLLPHLGKIEETAENLGEILKTEMGDPRRFDVGGDRLQATDLEIVRSDPEPGDTIELVAEVRRPAPPGAASQDGVLVHEERRSIRVDVYEWSSGVATGIGMIKAEKTDLANFEPGAIAVWRISYQPRPDTAGAVRRLGALRPGFGIHVSTLDFDEQDSVEFGAGVAIHLFKDLLQVGYGWNLNAEQDRAYWYLGLGLFDLLRNR